MMRNDNVTIATQTVFELVAAHASTVPVQVELRYHSGDPFAVLAAFRTGRTGWVEWVFARDLLADGLIARAGEGDVRIGPAGPVSDRVDIRLSSPSGQATFSARARDLAEFLDRTYEIIPPGAEYDWLNFDRGLERLLSNETS